MRKYLIYKKNQIINKKLKIWLFFFNFLIKKFGLYLIILKGKAHSLCIDQSGSLFTWGAGKIYLISFKEINSISLK